MKIRDSSVAESMLPQNDMGVERDPSAESVSFRMTWVERDPSVAECMLPQDDIKKKEILQRRTILKNDKE